VVRYGEPWTAEQVLAEGGVEALRQKVAELAGLPLAEQAPEASQDAAGQAAVVPVAATMAAVAKAESPENRENVPADAGHPANSPAQQCPPEGSVGHPSKGSATDSVDPSSSTSAPAGGEA
jgi:hypothetical protein